MTGIRSLISMIKTSCSGMASIRLRLLCLFSFLQVTWSLHSNVPQSPYSLPFEQLDPTTQNIWASQPKCKSANAQVYFLPTQPKPAKVSVLTGPAKAAPELLQMKKDIDDVAPKLGVPPPPPPPSPVLPGVLDIIPTVVPPVEGTVPCNRKSKILKQIFERTSSILPNAFNYDQELLEGFLSSIGL